MEEVLTIAVISGAVGGAAGKFAEKAWESGAKWVSNYFKGHAPQARQKAEQNALDFLALLATRVKKLEEQSEVHRKIIGDSLNQPDFTVLLQKAMLSSAQTNDKQKHELLARLVAGRLTQDSESLFALCSKLACDAVSMLNARQLKILGLLAGVYSVQRGGIPPPALASKEMFSTWCADLLTKLLGAYQDLNPIEMDFLHLESLSCVKYDDIIIRDLGDVLSPPEENGLAFDYRAFSTTEVGRKMEDLWSRRLLQHALPTTVGQLIGIYVSDILTNSTTLFEGWGELRTWKL